MIIDFEQLNEVTIPRLNGGMGEVSARIFMNEHGKAMVSRIPKGSSIGLHKHETSTDYNYVLSGQGMATCDGNKETLTVGKCHCCPIGSMHEIINMGNEDLVLFTIVAENK